MSFARNVQYWSITGPRELHHLWPFYVYLHWHTKPFSSKLHRDRAKASIESRNWTSPAENGFHSTAQDWNEADSIMVHGLDICMKWFRIIPLIAEGAVRNPFHFITAAQMAPFPRANFSLLSP